MKKILALAVFAFVFVCAPLAHAKDIEIAVLGKSVHPYWSEVELGAKAAAKKYKVKLTFYVPLKEDVSQQISRIESFVAKKVDGIAFAASDPDAVVPVIKKAMKAKIPCVALDTDAPKTGRYAFIGTDSYASGKVAGEVMGKLLKGKGKVAIGTGSLTAQNSLDKIKGFKDALKKYPGVTFVKEIVDDEDPVKAVSVAEQVLQRHKDLAGYFAVYGVTSTGLGQAVKSSKKSGKIKAVTVDTTPDIVQYLKDGATSATIAQSPYMMGFKSVEILVQMKQKGVDAVVKTLPKNRFVNTGVQVVTKQSLNAYRNAQKKRGIPVKF